MRTGYLCGGIHLLSDDACNGWRQRVVREVPNVRWLDPMRRDYRGVEASHARKIVAGDLADIDRSDLLLVNATRPSWGTAMEVFYAARAGKAVYAVVEGPVSPWLRHHAALLLPSLDEAIRVLNYTA